MNSNKQGDIALGRAIAFFSGQGNTVSIPLTDSQRYDLIVDKDTILYRVQVKSTTRVAKTKFPVVGLRTLSTRVKGKDSVKHFDSTEYEWLFVYSIPLETAWLVPTSVITNRSELTLNDAYSLYILPGVV